MDEDDLEDAAPPAKKERASPTGFILAVVVLTALGAGAGGAFALLQVDTISAAATKRANETPEKAPDALAWAENTAVAELDPVITNLAQPSTTWVRLETAVVFDKEAVSDVERMKSEVTQDVLTFARTLNVGELEGASALAHLRDDLNERVRLRTGGVVQELILKSMVIQ